VYSFNILSQLVEMAAMSIYSLVACVQGWHVQFSLLWPFARMIEVGAFLLVGAVGLLPWDAIVPYILFLGALTATLLIIQRSLMERSAATHFALAEVPSSEPTHTGSILTRSSGPRFL